VSESDSSKGPVVVGVDRAVLRRQRDDGHCCRPVVLEVKTDPEVPPLPPHITFKQAMHFMHALGKGDPREGRVIKQTARQIASAVLPGRRKTRAD